MRLILDAKYKKVDLHKVMETQCQHLTTTQCNDSLKLLPKFEELFNGTLVNWEKYPVDFKLKEGVKTICSRPYPVHKVHEEMFKN